MNSDSLCAVCSSHEIPQRTLQAAQLVSKPCCPGSGEGWGTAAAGSYGTAAAADCGTEAREGCGAEGSGEDTSSGFQRRVHLMIRSF